jgi:hypothetical protein
MSVLGEIVARTSGRPFDEYVREEIFVPLGMHDCWVGMPEDHAAYGDRIGLMHNTAGAELAGADRLPRHRPPMPGATVEDPSRLDASTRCCSVAHTVCNCSRPKRSPRSPRTWVAMVDETFGIERLGLGFAIDTYITGRHSSTCARTAATSHRPRSRSRARRGLAVAQRHAGSERHHPRMDAIDRRLHRCGVGLRSRPRRLIRRPRCEKRVDARGRVSRRAARGAGSG